MDIAFARDATLEFEDGRRIGPKYMLDLGNGPGVERALAASSTSALDRAVHVQSRVESAYWVAHLSQGKVQNVANYAYVKGIMRDLERFRVNGCELCLVI